MYQEIDANSMALNSYAKFITPEYAEKFLLNLSVICTVILLGRVFWYCRNGIDFADEGFYLVWIAHPFKYGYSVSQFGFIYHALYVLLDGSIAALRQLNIFTTFSLTAFLANVSLKTVLDPEHTDRFSRYIIAAAVSTASLIFLVLWLPTPSYNWLAFQGLLVAAIGLVLSQKETSLVSIVGWLLIGVGGWLAFMAKPTTAAALCFCTAFYLLVAGKLNVRLLAASIATAGLLLAVSAVAIDGSVSAFIDRLQAGLHQAEQMGGGHQSSRLLRLENLTLGTKATLILTTASFLFFSVSFLPHMKQRIFVNAWYIFSIALSVPIFLIGFGIYHTVMVAGDFQHLVIWATPCAALLLGFSLSGLSGIAKIDRPQWALAITLAIFPYAFAFGTSNNYWYFAGLVSVLWVIAGLIVFAASSNNRNLTRSLITLGLATQFLTAMLMLSGLEGPYYQPAPIRTMNTRVVLGEKKSTLLLSDTYAHYISAMIDLANRSGFRSGTPMIDLTGHSPGVLFAIGASSTGLPWIIGDYSKTSGFAYSGSEKNAFEALTATSCDELGAAWILTEPDGPVALSPKVLAAYGADLSIDYETVGYVDTAPIVGGFKDTKKQYMLKPKRSLESAARLCIDAKEKEKAKTSKG